MDTLVQVIGIAIMCASLAGFFGSLLWIARWGRQPHNRE